MEKIAKSQIGRRTEGDATMKKRLTLSLKKSRRVGEKKKIRCMVTGYAGEKVAQWGFS